MERGATAHRAAEIDVEDAAEGGHLVFGATVTTTAVRPSRPNESVGGSPPRFDRKGLAKEHIEPLSQQVRWRWKALFGEDGLQLRPNGTIVRVVGDRELLWSQLSSGNDLGHLAYHRLDATNDLAVAALGESLPLSQILVYSAGTVASNLRYINRTGILDTPLRHSAVPSDKAHRETA